jgi:hypothetical protein
MAEALAKSAKVSVLAEVKISRLTVSKLTKKVSRLVISGLGKNLRVPTFGIHRGIKIQKIRKYDEKCPFRILPKHF